jgi:hypothetical protein
MGGSFQKKNHPSFCALHRGHWEGMEPQQIQDNKCNCQTFLFLSFSQRINLLNITTGSDKPIQLTESTSAFKIHVMNPSQMQDRRFPQWCSWGFRCSGTWCCVTGSMSAGTPLLDPCRQVNQLFQNAGDNTASHPRRTMEARTLQGGPYLRTHPKHVSCQVFQITLLGSLSSLYNAEHSWAGRSERSLWSWPLQDLKAYDSA